MKVIQLKKWMVYFVLITVLIFIIWCIVSIFAPVAETFLNNHELMVVNKQVSKTYIALDGKFSFILPDSWTTWSESFGGDEIVYHLYFKAPNKKINGFIQVWKLNVPLKQFLDESKKSSVGIVSFKYFNIKEIMPNKKRGYLVEYSRMTENGEYIKAYEAFIEGDENLIYRASFFVKENEWKNYHPIIFNKIVKSFEF